MPNPVTRSRSSRRLLPQLIHGRRAVSALVGLTAGALLATLGLTAATAAGSDPNPPGTTTASGTADRPAAAPATAAVQRHPRPGIVLTRGGAAATVDFASTGGEGLVDLTAWAPGTNWQRVGDESAVATLLVDGRYVTDLLVPGSLARPRELQLGGLTAGSHTLTLRFADDRSPNGASQVDIAGLRVRTVGPNDADYVALAHSPILYGRSMPAYGGAFQNTWTDAPLIAWHYATKLDNGNTALEYQIVWSNEDGGTDTNPPSEQARWGRLTDIEWIYRVQVHPDGSTVPGTETFQAPSHQTSQFAGTHEGAHPLLQTCTDNNNVCDQLTDAKMRFFLSTQPTMDADTQAREQIMDAYPWTYAVMGKEMIREHHTEKVPNPETAELSDARDYLYVVIGKTTDPYSSSTPWVGTSIGVKVRGHHGLYRSDHNIPDFSLQRDGQAATTVELPAGTRMRDITKIVAIRYPTSVRADPGSVVTVTSMNRAYLLDRQYRPVKPYLTWQGRVTLTEEHPRAVLYRR